MGFKVNVRTAKQEMIAIKFDGNMKSIDAFELSVSGNGVVGVSPGVNPPAPPFPLNGVVVVGIGVLGLFIDVVVGVVPPAVL
ncbi:hypothetical protein FNV43_RR02355 [Rhamnella rubrinervis]|uniref:Uncharacterized protein n=1 Tax=Rhamnella rubrinervis TaxID=2594499 RepID=A0A8K0HRB4_9ROSA|nr:hypothetical protein FNV43_RR02355 [Rhamnella rubrinervis]